MDQVALCLDLIRKHRRWKAAEVEPSNISMINYKDRQSIYIEFIDLADVPGGEVHGAWIVDFTPWKVPEVIYARTLRRPTGRLGPLR